MWATDWIQVVTLIASALAASGVAAVAGFGGAVLLLPVLVWVFGVRDAVPILTVAQCVGNGSRVASGSKVGRHLPTTCFQLVIDLPTTWKPHFRPQ